MQRKAQGLSTSTLILIALGILILITSIVFYSSIVDDSRETIGNCENLGGACLSSCDENRPFQNRLGTCPTGQVCCVGNT